MKRSIALLTTFALILSLLCTSCGKKKEEQKEPESAPQETNSLIKIPTTEEELQGDEEETSDYSAMAKAYVEAIKKEYDECEKFGIENDYNMSTSTYKLLKVKDSDMPVLITVNEYDYFKPFYYVSVYAFNDGKATRLYNIENAYLYYNPENEILGIERGIQMEMNYAVFMGGTDGKVFVSKTSIYGDEEDESNDQRTTYIDLSQEEDESKADNSYTAYATVKGLFNSAQNGGVELNILNKYTYTYPSDPSEEKMIQGIKIALGEEPKSEVVAPLDTKYFINNIASVSKNADGTWSVTADFNESRYIPMNALNEAYEGDVLKDNKEEYTYIRKEETTLPGLDNYLLQDKNGEYFLATEPYFETDARVKSGCYCLAGCDEEGIGLWNNYREVKKGITFNVSSDATVEIPSEEFSVTVEQLFSSRGTGIDIPYYGNGDNLGRMSLYFNADDFGNIDQFIIQPMDP